MSNSDYDDDSLPEGWVLCQSKSTPGRKYFFNRKTGKSSWTRPELDKSSEVIKTWGEMLSIIKILFKAIDLTSQSNKKTKLDKEEKREKLKKEEAYKKNLKRKSDSHHEGSSPKKKVTVVPDLKTPEVQKKQTQSNALPKNSANKRLNNLRSRLSEEVQREEASSTSNLMKSPAKPTTKKETKFSPKCNQSETGLSKTSSKANELKSPVQSESSTVQSPSDSIPSIPSPSQFLAANKILSSMKAQLPEEYSIRTKTKVKDTFADIEAGICSQSADYTSLKHPLTPPQFSEANKIVSAIKSKLAYRSTIKDYSELEAYTSAKERMEALRKSLSNETEDLSESPTEVTALNRLTSISSISSLEAMDVEESRIVIPQASSPETTAISASTECSNENLVLVVDTNIFIHELDVIKNSLNSHIRGHKEQPTLLVPWRVVSELDRLKDNNNGAGAVCKRARQAMDYLYQSLPENNKIKGQSLRDANSHIYPCELPDDEILNCCLQQAERGNAVILLSNDKNLCNKALINGVKCLSLLELRSLLERRADPALKDTWARLAAAAHALLANILENEMRAKYDSLWQHVVVRPPPWSLRDVLDSLLRHWPAVFQEVFPRIQHLLAEARDAVRAQADLKNLTQSDVDHFRDLCLEIARKCQIIPEYMALAKKTVERVMQKTEQCQVVNSTQDEGSLVPGFEAVWTVFSSFCAKLASGLEVPHNLEDRVDSGDPLPALVEKWAVFSEQTREFTLAIHGALSLSEESDPADERLARLEGVFKDNLTLINLPAGGVTPRGLKAFCTKCRDMLQEAYTKFSQLSELLDVCRDVMRPRDQ